MTKFRSTMLRWLALLSVLVGLLFSASAPSRAGGSSPRSSGKKPITLRVGVDHTPPFYYVEAGKPVRGLAVSILNEAAARVGYKLVWMPQDKLSVNDAVGTGAVDLWPLVTPTSERKARFFLSEPWLESDYAVVSLEEHPVLRPSDAKGLLVAHANLQLSSKVTRAFFKESRFIQAPDRVAALIDLCSQAAVAVVIETRVLDSLLLKRPEPCSQAAFRISTIPGANHPLAIMSSRSTEAYAHVIANEIQELEQDGILSTALDLWCPFTAEVSRSIWAKKAANRQSQLFKAGALLISLLALVLGFVLHRDVRLRKKAELAETAFRDSQNLFRAFFDHSPIPAYLKDELGRVVLANSAVVKAYMPSGFDPVGKTSPSIWPADVAEALLVQDRVCRERNEPIQTLTILPSSTGELRHWLITRFPILQSGAGYMGGVCLDVTEREQAALELAESEARYRALFTLSPFPAWVYDRETFRFLAVNDAAVRQYGWTAQEFRCSLSLGEIEIDGHQTQAPQDDRISVCRWYRTKDESTRKVEVTSYSLQYKGRPACLALMRDLTEQELTLEQLRLSENRWQLALRGAGDVLWDWDIASGRVFRSQLCLDMLGYVAEEMPSTHDGWVAIVCPEDRDMMRGALDAHLQRKTGVYTCEYRVLHRDGTWRWLLDRGQAVWDERGRALRMAGSHADITERKLAEQRLSSEAKTDGLTGVANRREFDRVLETMLNEARQGGTPLTLCISDLDHFKQINDRFGHGMGDQVLSTFARIAQDTLRKSDLVARTGGDEFIFLLPGTTADEGLVFADRVRRRFEAIRFEPVCGAPVSASCSFGIAQLKLQHRSGAELFAAADNSLYEAKKLGRNCVMAA